MRPDDGISSPARRYLFVMWDSAGALIVTLRLAAQLIHRGHAVHVLGPATIERKVRAAGCAFVCDHVMTPYDPARDHHTNEGSWFREHVWFGAVDTIAREVVEVAGALGIEAIVFDDMLFGAMVGADATGLPTACLSPELLGSMSRLEHLPIENPGRAFWEWGLDRLNTARIGLGLPPFTSIAEQWRAFTRQLVLSLPELDTASDLPANMRYVGPPREEIVPEPVIAAPGTLPLIVVSFSTSHQGQREVLQRVVDGIAQLPVEGVVTLGYAMATEQLRLPAHVSAVAYLPHDTVLPRTDVVVTHAGHGTVMSALAHGVPMVCMPMGRDQFHNAKRITALGVGVTIAANAGPDEIARAIDQVLCDRSFSDHANRFRAVINAYVEKQAGVAELERLGRTP